MTTTRTRLPGDRRGRIIAPPDTLIGTQRTTMLVYFEE
jgi:hypothetical protein